jgi:hypothetical protein
VPIRTPLGNNQITDLGASIVATSQRKLLALSGLILGLVLAGCAGPTNEPAASEPTQAAQSPTTEPTASEPTVNEPPVGDTETLDWDQPATLAVTVAPGDYGVLEYDIYANPTLEVVIPEQSVDIYDLASFDNPEAFNDAYGDDAALAGIPIVGLANGEGQGAIVVTSGDGSQQVTYFTVTVE